ncbi:glucose 1-dehydrogenase [Aureimonas sp. ME7]|uniref:glucose 1-dehydrogenase n=1 Tax=Aureimonas sp. ME7 TaxID=2744252 RepID=UPI0015F59AD2|nr:glucose 1-dehydrogenase [Aureimonas sp. ME7]
MSEFDLSGRVALVTGASRGLGAAIAPALARAGADVVLSARRIADLEATRILVEETGQRALCLAMDVTDVPAIRAGIAEAAQAFGRLDILVNNAGTEKVCPSLDVEEALWDRILDTNLKGAFFAAQAAARLMRDTGGSIVNLCSLTSFVGVPTAVPYGSSKSGLLGMTRALATEWGPLGIRVNAIAPGYFRTAMTDAFYEDDAWQGRIAKRLPLGRFGQETDLGGAAVFLASDASRYVTGQCLAVDGGFLASI